MIERGEGLKMLSVRNSMGEELTWENDIEVILREYFFKLLNGDEISEVGGDVRRGRIRRNERVK